jgi:fumarylacetoacetate (FAA) hydrolase family protein
MKITLEAGTCLPEDGCKGTLLGRAWVPGPGGGPAVVSVREEGVFDLSRLAPTTTELVERPDAAKLVRGGEGSRLGSLEEILTNSAADARDPARPWFLAPIDLQAIKAAGVTFAISLIERVIEEQAKGDTAAAESIRNTIAAEIGTTLGNVKPGSPKAMGLKQALIKRGLWSQYLEVGIGPDAEVFTKSQPMSAVGVGAEIGVHPRSTWNNPEPEVVVVVNSRGETVGATLGNDVNLRDFEGRSALLLGKAKDNNASCAIGPFVRLFDDTFGIDDVRQASLTLKVEGDEGFLLDGYSTMTAISRDVLDLVGQTIGANHQYPDGLVLFLGTLFAPVKDRDQPKMGFTHKVGDRVTIASPKLGALVNRVNTSDRIAPWTFGTAALMRNLRQRGLL